MFKRLIEEKIEKYIKGKDYKTFYIWGPRRSGKTTILQKLAKELGVRVFNFDFSSELRQKVKEFDTQAGRFTEHYCLPLSLKEIKTNSNLPSYEEEIFEKKLQEELQVFGSYPEVYATRGLTDEAKTRLLENIVQTYILKDIVDIY